MSTAAIPWMTGTAVNPTLRAAYLAHCTDLKVRWLELWGTVPVRIVLEEAVTCYWCWMDNP